MIKYILFDFDGTLADSKDVFISAWNQLADKYKFKKIHHQDLDALRKLSIKERAKQLNFPLYKIPLVVPEIYRLYKKSIKDIILFDGVKLLLDELESRGYQIVIISSNSEGNIKEFLRENAVDSVKEVLCSSKIFGKDQVIKKFLQTNKLKGSEVIYIGDECRDIIACKKVPVKIIWVGWGYDSAELVTPEKPDYMVHMPEEILNIL
ncbi:HAD-IA family hydrolase [Ectobacillus funiculus]|uniref:HAD-IA family hydrolase n=1 Tax=Ectobacillus funiculus TaxID=137993 RepID=UPI00196A4143|nr:HAD-IA family hydrolase [Ectobacillus funiculus]